MILEKTNILEKLDIVSKKIGNTPLLPILNEHTNKNVQIYAKVEWEQFSGSVKARAAFNIIKQAIIQGKLDENKILLDATSGNTGIAYAAICKELGLKLTLCLPENASKERKEILKNLGADIFYTSKYGGTEDAQDKAQELALDNPEKYFYANQYTNDNNWKAHYYGTSLEIIRDLPDITHFVAGLGTTGTFTGTSKRLKEYNSNIQTISLQPDLALHGLEGWKHLETAKIPKIYNPNIADENIEISTTETYAFIKKYSENNILLSPSSAANILGAIKLSNKIENGIIVTVLPDNAQKYSELINKIF